MVRKKVEKSAKRMDKVVTGIVIGGAIGSVLGMALSPKSGKENREAVKKEAEKLYDKGLGFVEKKEKEFGIKPKKKENIIKRISKLMRG